MIRTQLLGQLSRRRAVSLGAGMALAITARARAQVGDPGHVIASMSGRERAARMFMFPVSGTTLTTEDGALLRRLKPGGVILVQANFGTPDEVRALVDAIHATNPELPPLVALDQEGGLVSRIADDPAPDAPTLGLLSPAEIADFA